MRGRVEGIPSEVFQGYDTSGRCRLVPQKKEIGKAGVGFVYTMTFDERERELLKRLGCEAFVDTKTGKITFRIKQDRNYIEKNISEFLGSRVMRAVAANIGLDPNLIGQVELAPSSKFDREHPDGKYVFLAVPYYRKKLDLYQDAYLAYHFLEDVPFRDMPEYDYLTRRTFPETRPTMMHKDDLVNLMIKTGRYKQLGPVSEVTRVPNDPDVHYENLLVVPDDPESNPVCVVKVDKKTGRMIKIDPRIPKESSDDYEYFSLYPEVHAVKIDHGASHGDYRLGGRNLTHARLDMSELERWVHYHPTHEGPPDYPSQIPNEITHDKSTLRYLKKIANLNNQVVQDAYAKGLEEVVRFYSKDDLKNFARLIGMTPEQIRDNEAEKDKLKNAILIFLVIAFEKYKREAAVIYRKRMEERGYPEEEDESVAAVRSGAAPAPRARGEGIEGAGVGDFTSRPVVSGDRASVPPSIHVHGGHPGPANKVRGAHLQNLADLLIAAQDNTDRLKEIWRENRGLLLDERSRPDENSCTLLVTKIATSPKLTNYKNISDTSQTAFDIGDPIPPYLIIAFTSNEPVSPAHRGSRVIPTDIPTCLRNFFDASNTDAIESFNLLMRFWNDSNNRNTILEQAVPYINDDNLARLNRLIASLPQDDADVAGKKISNFLNFCRLYPEIEGTHESIGYFVNLLNKVSNEAETDQNLDFLKLSLILNKLIKPDTSPRDLANQLMQNSEFKVFLIHPDKVDNFIKFLDQFKTRAPLPRGVEVYQIQKMMDALEGCNLKKSLGARNISSFREIFSIPDTTTSINSPAGWGRIIFCAGIPLLGTLPKLVEFGFAALQNLCENQLDKDELAGNKSAGRRNALILAAGTASAFRVLTRFVSSPFTSVKKAYEAGNRQSKALGWAMGIGSALISVATIGVLGALAAPFIAGAGALAGAAKVLTAVGSVVASVIPIGLPSVVVGGGVLAAAGAAVIGMFRAAGAAISNGRKWWKKRNQVAAAQPVPVVAGVEASVPAPDIRGGTTYDLSRAGVGPQPQHGARATSTSSSASLPPEAATSGPPRPGPGLLLGAPPTTPPPKPPTRRSGSGGNQ